MLARARIVTLPSGALPGAYFWNRLSIKTKLFGDEAQTNADTYAKANTDAYIDAHAHTDTDTCADGDHLRQCLLL